MRRRLLLAATTLCALVAGCGDAPLAPRAKAGCDHVEGRETCAVLFLGNSISAGITDYDVPTLLHKLAASGGVNVSTKLIAPGGWTLPKHLASSESLGALADDTWNVVVMQDQSVLPVSTAYRQAEMEPVVRSFAEAIRRERAQPLLFATPAWSSGAPEWGLYSYGAMQAAINAAYESIGRTLDVPVAPVGSAWSEALVGAPGVALWMDDGHHPDVAGLYLAACVFYATIFDRSPEGLPFDAGLTAPTAAKLQAAAWRTVAGSAADQRVSLRP